ncbi:hypothetical protein F5Y12DRAFT_715474 [Xylaria sp. FL1777]|nr:hypothetical protein F5Y12DRAFT_715474 [Xylaria sp. FL1777]
MVSRQIRQCNVAVNGGNCTEPSLPSISIINGITDLMETLELRLQAVSKEGVEYTDSTVKGHTARVDELDAKIKDIVEDLKKHVKKMDECNSENCKRITALENRQIAAEWNAYCRMFNSCDQKPDDELCPLQSIENKPIEGFPRTFSELEKMPLDKIQKILKQLGYTLEEDRPSALEQLIFLAGCGNMGDWEPCSLSLPDPQPGH